MIQFKYCGLCCKFINKEEASFERGCQKITFEKDVTKNAIPMYEYDFDFIYDEKDGTYFVCQFNVDKFGIAEIVLQNVLKDRENEKIHIYCHIDAYKKDDMKYFKIGSMFRVNTVCK